MEIGNGQLLGARDSQQDYFATIRRDANDILILADGIGGLHAGEHASQIAVKSCKQYVSACDLGDPKVALSEGMKRANHAIAMVGDDDSEKRGMGTTFIIALITETEFYWLSVGDSLIYRYRNGILSRLNALHTRVAELQEDVKRGSITQSQADATPDRFSITSALTGDEINHTDINSVSRWDGDRFLIASDGIQTLRHSAIQRMVGAEESAHTIVESLTQSIEQIADEFQDNCTILLAMPPVEGKPASSRKRPIALYFTFFILMIIGVALLMFWFLNQNSQTPNQVSQEESAKQVIVKPEIKTESPKVGAGAGESGNNSGESNPIVEQPEPESDIVLPQIDLTPDKRNKNPEAKAEPSKKGFFTNNAEEADETPQPSK